ncbi:carbon-nitrogen hydrolase family protein [Geodermatophilus sp. URMC 61]|uniref:carbon-nitrogen hydrolase family protein n=1 Tax=Geodermatophilus sp. URMC 61 TaxID=3423411 RepID=UPI00406CF71F
MSVEPPLPAARADVRRASLVVAAAQPRCVAGDVATNVAAHVEAIHEARARLVVFPELSLTGYLLSAAPLTLEDPVLGPLVTACAATHTAALVGAPVIDGAGRRSIAVLLVTGGGVRVVYRKTHLGGDEPAHFTAGDGPAVVEVDGWRIGLGVCKDTGVAEHVIATAALDVDVYAAGLVHAPDELAEQDARGVRIAATCAAHVVFASAAGPVGGPYDETAGSSTVWAPDGSVLARADAAPGRFAGTTIRTA